MEFLVALIFFALGLRALNVQNQGARIRFLSEHLSRFRVEKQMADVQLSTLRALAESDPERQAPIWAMLEGMQADLCQQLHAFVLAFAKVDAALARTSRWPVPVPYATQWAPAASFDLRKVLGIHAKGLQNACELQVPAKEKAFVFMAEMLLLQHSCHWFCRSKITASARLLRQHKTPFAQVLASVGASTRQSYCALVGV